MHHLSVCMLMRRSSRASGLHISCNGCPVTGPSFSLCSRRWRPAWGNESALSAQSGSSKAVVGSSGWCWGADERRNYWSGIVISLLHFFCCCFIYHWLFPIVPLIFCNSVQLLTFCSCPPQFLYFISVPFPLLSPSVSPLFPLSLPVCKSLTLSLWGSKRPGVESLLAESLLSFMSLRDCLLQLACRHRRLREGGQGGGGGGKKLVSSFSLFSST